MRIISLLCLLALAAANGLAQTITERIYGRQGSAEELPEQLVEMPDGSLLIAGYLTRPGGGGFYDVFLQKLDAGGAPLWLRTYGGAANDVALCAAAAPDGGFVFGGYTESEGQGRADGFIKKADAEGDLEWTALFGAAGWDQVTRVSATASGHYLVCGTAVYDKNTNGQDVFWALLDAQGAVLAQEVIASEYLDEAWDIAESPDGNIVVLYRSVYYTCAKYSPSGQLLWKHDFNDAEGGAFLRMDIDAGGQIYLASVIQGSNAFHRPVVCLDAFGQLAWKMAPVLAGGRIVDIEAGIDQRIRAVFQQAGNPIKAVVLEFDKSGELLHQTAINQPAGDIIADAAVADSGRLLLLNTRYSYQQRQNDAALIAYQFNGSDYTPSWSQSYGDTAPVETDFHLHTIRSTQNTFFSAYFSYNPAIQDFSLWLLHADTAGNILANTDIALPVDLLSAPIQATPDGGCAVLTTNYMENYLIKTDAGGQVQWQKKLDLPIRFRSTLADFQVMPDGGYTLFSSPFQPVSGYPPALCRLDQQGNLLWIKELELATPAVYLHKMLPLPGGGYVFQGGQFDPANQQWNLVLAFADSEGTIQREIRREEDLYIGAWSSDGKFMHCSDGGFLLAGRFVYSGAPNNTQRTGVALLKLDAFGARQWDTQLQDLTGNADVAFISLEEVPCRGYVLSAISHPQPTNLPWITRYDDDLRILQWIDYRGQVQGFFNMKTYPGPGAADFNFLPGYTYYEWGDKLNPNYLDLYFWRVQFPPEPDPPQPTGVSVAISPNPSGHTICLSFASGYTGPLEADIFDVGGRLVDHFTALKTEAEWMTRYYNPLSPGHYFVRIKAGAEFITTHWVKE